MFLPPRMDEVGIPNREFKVVDLGYRPYSILLTTDRMIENEPELVRETVEAVQRGWRNFIADSGPSTNLMLPQNKMISSKTHSQAVDIILSEFLPDDASKVGCMDASRWDELADQMKLINALPADFNPSNAYDMTFLKGC